jgi:chromosome segregation ATPase
MNKKELLEDLGQLKSELRYLTSLYGYKMSLANQLDEEMTELDIRRDSIKRQIYDIEVEITDCEGC